MTFTIIAFYKFVHIDDPTALRSSLKAFCAAQELCGTVLVATEGINATVAGNESAVESLVAFLRQDARFFDIEPKVSYTAERPFGKMKVRLKKEIVTFGAPDSDRDLKRGIYVNAKDWNELITRPEVKLVDTRNAYEVVMGTFAHAINPKTESFTEFRSFVDTQLDPAKDTEVAMFCTGGIRCEKATAYLVNKGFKRVYHLEGGILKYLEDVPREDSLFRGECYVFDNRITVADGLEPGSYEAVPHTDNEYLKKTHA